ncbi:hypothetical protein vseg_019912 [Gypsophila vaccaria]
MSSISPNSQNPDPKTLENQNPDPKTVEEQNPETTHQPTNPNETGQDHKIGEDGGGGEGEDGDEDEDEGECGFCLFMKGGGCKDVFVAWEKCVEEGEKKNEDIADKCFEVTSNLKKCMEAHSEYYDPILRAEKAAGEEAKQELDRLANEPETEGKTVEIEVEKTS